MNKYLAMLLGAILLAGLGYAFGRYAQPAKVVIKTEIQTVEVEKKRNNIVTVTHEVEQKDGTKIIDTRTEDKSIEMNTIDQTVKQTETITNAKPNWKVQGLAGANYLHLTSDPLVYTVDVEHRFIGPIFLGAYGRSDKEIGLSISVEF